MQYSKLYEKNLEWLRKNGYAKAIEGLAHIQSDSTNVAVEEARSGARTIKIDGKYFHSKYDPEREAKKLLEKHVGTMENDKPILLYGNGLGYLLKAFNDAFPNKTIYVYERSYRVFKAFLESVDIQTDTKNVEFVFDNSGNVNGFEEVPKANRIFWSNHQLYEDRTTLYTTQNEKEYSNSEKLRILVVSPLYGGSYPVSKYVKSAFENLGHTVFFQDNSVFNEGRLFLDTLTHNKESKAALFSDYVDLLGNAVVAKALDVKAQLVFFLAQSPGTKKALDTLKNHSIPTAFWFVEDGMLFDYALPMAKHYDVFFHIQKGDFEEKLKAHGARRTHYLPMAAAPSIHRPIGLSKEERRFWGSDLSHMGAGYYNRRNFFLGVTDFDFKIWGNEWDGANGLRDNIQLEGRRINVDETVKVFNATKINLNLHSSTHIDGVNPDGDFVNPRTFEIAACGGFQLVDKRKLLPELFDEEKEIVTFDNLDDCRKKIKYYLDHFDKAKEIALAGRKKVLEQHTYEKRMQEALSVIYRTCKIPYRDEKPAITLEDMIEKAGEDGELIELLNNMEAKDKEIELKDIIEHINNNSGDLNKTEALFILMNEFYQWASEKGLV